MSSENEQKAVLEALTTVTKLITEDKDLGGTGAVRDLASAAKDLAEAHAWLRMPAQPH